MQYPIKSASLSRHASTSHHGRLLQDSGFTKLDSTPDLSESWEPTITSRQDVWYSRSSTPTGRLSSGRPEIQSIPRVGRSTSAQASLATGCTQSIGRIGQMSSAKIVESLQALMDQVPTEPFPLFLPKTSYRRLRSACLEQGLAMPSWVHHLGSIPSPSLYDMMLPLYCGSIQMEQARQREQRSLSNCDWLGLFPRP